MSVVGLSVRGPAGDEGGAGHPSKDDEQRKPLDQAAERRRNIGIEEASRGDQNEHDGREHDGGHPGRVAVGGRGNEGGHGRQDSVNSHFSEKVVNRAFPAHCRTAPDGVIPRQPCDCSGDAKHDESRQHTPAENAALERPEQPDPERDGENAAQDQAGPENPRVGLTGRRQPTDRVGELVDPGRHGRGPNDGDDKDRSRRRAAAQEKTIAPVHAPPSFTRLLNHGGLIYGQIAQVDQLAVDFKLLPGSGGGDIGLKASYQPLIEDGLREPLPEF